MLRRLHEQGVYVQEVQTLRNAREVDTEAFVCWWAENCAPGIQVNALAKEKAAKVCLNRFVFYCLNIGCHAVEPGNMPQIARVSGCAQEEWDELLSEMKGAVGSKGMLVNIGPERFQLTFSETSRGVIFEVT